MSQNDLNSNINLGLVQDPPDSIKTPEGRSIYVLFIAAFNNLIRYIEQYTGITQKDITLWSLLTPSDTILTYNLRRLYVKAAVNLAYGNFVNLYNAGADLQARKADSGVPLLAHGYISSTETIVAGDFCEVILFEGLVSIGGVVRGTSYYLAPAGAIAAAPGATRQFVGFGVATDLLCVNIETTLF